jgi:prepilin-type N-terminal cleavage/methylation domain-containing protein/prepilin-type processing-associated H-X9-DG protein
MKQNPQTSHFQYRRQGGFTLVELLVVIAIIAVLAALVIGGSIRIRQKAYEATALNSIRQVTMANTSYSMENFGDINVLLDAGDPRATGQFVSNNYWGRLVPYLFDDITTSDQAQLTKEIKVRLAGLFSTNDASTMPKTFQAGSQIYHDGSGCPVPFGFSKSVYQWNKYKKTSQYENPALTIYMSYGFYRFDAQAAKTYYPVPKKGTARSTNIDFFPSKTAAFTFLDGHVEILSAPVNERHFPDVPQ